MGSSLSNSRLLTASALSEAILRFRGSGVGSGSKHKAGISGLGSLFFGSCGGRGTCDLQHALQPFFRHLQGLVLLPRFPPVLGLLPRLLLRPSSAAVWPSPSSSRVSTTQQLRVPRSPMPSRPLRGYIFLSSSVLKPFASLSPSLARLLLILALVFRVRCSCLGLLSQARPMVSACVGLPTWSQDSLQSRHRGPL